MKGKGRWSEGASGGSDYMHPLRQYPETRKLLTVFTSLATSDPMRRIMMSSGIRPRSR